MKQIHRHLGPPNPWTYEFRNLIDRYTGLRGTPMDRIRNRYRSTFDTVRRQVLSQSAQKQWSVILVESLGRLFWNENPRF